jgi:hypothetical protein
MNSLYSNINFTGKYFWPGETSDPSPANTFRRMKTGWPDHGR